MSGRFEIKSGDAPAQFKLGLILDATRDRAGAIKQSDLLKNIDQDYARRFDCVIFRDKNVLVGGNGRTSSISLRDRARSTRRETAAQLLKP